jgi:tRNA A-37 threonylcarbamoyl transferase component Bud32
MTVRMTEAAEAADAPVDRFKLVGSVLEQKFKVERLVAEGGFGIVYYGAHITLEKAIAIKVLKTPSEFNEKARNEFAEKFALEAKTIARMSHPNIVQVLDFGVSEMPSGERAPWMVLEWMTGQTLDELLEARRGQGGRSPAEAFALLKPVLEALAYAHEEGVAHRDIKPANIMVVQTKRGPTVRLMDFGIAKLMDENEQAGSGNTRTRTTMNAFSPQYASPEQISNTRTGPWTDVHALGLILTEVLTDQPPYDAEDMTELYAEILSPQRPTPAKRGMDAGPWEQVLAKALAIKPEERFRTAGELLAALEEAIPPELRPKAGANSAGAFATSAGASGAFAVAPDGTEGLGSTRFGTETGIMPSPRRSRLPLALGVGALLLLGAIGLTVFLQNGHGTVPPAPTARPTPPVAAPVPAPPPVTTVAAPAPGPVTDAGAPATPTTSAVMAPVPEVPSRPSRSRTPRGNRGQRGSAAIPLE